MYNSTSHKMTYIHKHQNLLSSLPVTVIRVVWDFMSNLWFCCLTIIYTCSANNYYLPYRHFYGLGTSSTSPPKCSIKAPILFVETTQTGFTPHAYGKSPIRGTLNWTLGRWFHNSFRHHCPSHWPFSRKLYLWRNTPSIDIQIAFCKTNPWVTRHININAPFGKEIIPQSRKIVCCTQPCIVTVMICTKVCFPHQCVIWEIVTQPCT